MKRIRKFILLASLCGLGLLNWACEEAGQVRFANGEVVLVAEMWKPQTSGLSPAAVFIQGPGRQRREDLRPLAKYLSEHGIAALLYDMRDAGNFSGDWTTADFQVLAGDALAAVRHVQQLPDIRQDAVGVIGFSRGGGISAHAASAAKDLAFVIMVSTPVISPSEPADDDLLPVLQNLQPPLLLLFGEKDSTIAVEKSVAQITAAMHEAGKKNFALRVVPNAEHSLYTKPFHDSPLPLLQNLPLSPRFEPEALEAMVYWIKVAAPLFRSRAQ